ncbi:zinc finger-containing protein [Stachybotrys elegans]|uniref:Zinc finger-containing protein n=1 Tax=Stachybotrys elegans TaxID=80388 RepID=A0A8K0SN72_9HYPO|nr:zinc finger-containing protein [Stachybotrys elegans]
MSHSKRNTSRPVFTAHERALAKSHWTAGSARLNRDSFLPFGYCGLCLEVARDPVACQRGDIFCRECVLSNLLAQKKELKRADRARAEAEREIERIKTIEDEEDRERAIRDFELTQAGLEATTKHKPRAVDPPISNDQQLVKAGSKRKFALDEGELSRIVQEDRAKARKAIEDEKAAKPTLPSFWSPSLTPDIQDSKLAPVAKKTKTSPVCPASTDENPHSLSLQKLIELKFHEDIDDNTKEKRKTCPSCRKLLSNSSSPVLAKQCGHVLCQPCVKQFLLPSKQTATEPQVPLTCFVCSEPLAATPSKNESDSSGLPPGLVALRSEGTGFSARGSSTVSKTGLGFQC